MPTGERYALRNCVGFEFVVAAAGEVDSSGRTGGRVGESHVSP